MASPSGFSDMLRQLGDWLGITLVVASVAVGIVTIAYFIYAYNAGVEDARARILEQKNASDAQLEIEKLKKPPLTIACYDGNNRLVFGLQGLGNVDFHPMNATGNMCIGNECSHCSVINGSKKWDEIQKPVAVNKPDKKEQEKTKDTTVSVFLPKTSK